MADTNNDMHQAECKEAVVRCEGGNFFWDECAWRDDGSHDVEENWKDWREVWLGWCGRHGCRDARGVGGPFCIVGGFLILSFRW